MERDQAISTTEVIKKSFGISDDTCDSAFRRLTALDETFNFIVHASSNDITSQLGLFSILNLFTCTNG